MPYQFRGGRTPSRPKKNATFAPKGVSGPKKTRLGPPVKRPGAAPGPQAPANKPKPQAKPRGEGFQPDSLYNEDIGAINTHTTEALNNIAGEKQNVEHTFGINDPTNPMSRMEGLKRAFLARRKGASAGLASQGQLYSGAHERALSRTRLEEEQAKNDLYTAYQKAIGGLTQSEQETKYGSEEARRQAFEEWLQRAPEADAGEEPAGDAGGAIPPPATGAGTLVDKGTGQHGIGGEKGKDEPQAIAFGGPGRKKGKGKGKKRNASYSRKRTSGPQKTTLGGATKPKPKPKPAAKKKR